MFRSWTFCRDLYREEGGLRQDHESEDMEKGASEVYGMITGYGDDTIIPTGDAADGGGRDSFNLYYAGYVFVAVCDATDAESEFALMGLSPQAKLDNMNTKVKLWESNARFDKWKESSKNLVKLINSSMSSRSKFGLGFRDTFGSDEVIFMLPSNPWPDIDDTQYTYGSKSNLSVDTNSGSNDFVSCDNSDKSSDSETTDFGSSYDLEPKSPLFQLFSRCLSHITKWIWMGEDGELLLRPQQGLTRNWTYNSSRYVVPTGSRKRTGRDPRGNIMILPPVTMEEQIAVQREIKARTILLQSLPEDHMADFHQLMMTLEIDVKGGSSYDLRVLLLLHTSCSLGAASINSKWAMFLKMFFTLLLLNVFLNNRSLMKTLIKLDKLDWKNLTTMADRQAFCSNRNRLNRRVVKNSSLYKRCCQGEVDSKTRFSQFKIKELDKSEENGLWSYGDDTIIPTGDAAVRWCRDCFSAPAVFVAAGNVLLGFMFLLLLVLV
ncbi:hypothetical protein Tco_0552131 [Tanacetum coccineum]